MNDDDKAGIARHNNIRQMVAAYDSAKADIIAGFELFARARETYDSAFSLGHNIDRLSIMSHRRDICDEPKEALDNLKRQAWRHLVAKLELKRMMSVERWAKLDKQLDSDDLPEVTVETVLAWGQEQFRALPEMLREAVSEVFEWLRPHNSDYKRNSEYEVPEKVVLTWMVEPKYFANSGYKVMYRQSQKLIALENVFNALDGKGQISKSWQSELEQAIDAMPPGAKRGETSLFEFTCHKNKNLHLTFKRLDLLQRFNQMAGGKRLRGADAA